MSTEQTKDSKPVEKMDDISQKEEENSDFEYDKAHSFVQRCEETKKILEKSGNERIPIIIEKSKTCKDPTLATIDTKFLAPRTMTVAEFQKLVRKRIKLTAEQAMYIFVLDPSVSNKASRYVLPAGSQTIGALYDEKKGKDGFLRITYATENVFGSDNV